MNFFLINNEKKVDFFFPSYFIRNSGHGVFIGQNNYECV